MKGGLNKPAMNQKEIFEFWNHD